MTQEQILKEKTELLNKKNQTPQEWFTTQLIIHSNKTQLVTALRSVKMLQKIAYKEDAQKLGLTEVLNSITHALTLEHNGVDK